MGIYDRDYYRADHRRWNAWLTGRGTVGLILMMSAVYIVQLVNRPPIGGGFDAVTTWCGFNLSRVVDGQLWRLLTASFLHDSWNPWPIILGMIALYYFGTGVEGVFGTREFLTFYGTAVVVTQTAEFLVRFTGIEDPHTYSFGSVGPVMAVTTVFACLYPREKILVCFVIPVPVWICALAIAIFAIAGLVDQRPGFRGSPALVISGSLFGLIYHVLQLRLSPYLPTFGGERQAMRVRPKLRVVPAPEGEEDEDAESEPVTAGRAPAVDEQFEAKVDDVLEKMARHGKASLTTAEQDLLLRASELYKRRRGS